MSKKHLEQKVRDKAAERDRYMSELFLAEERIQTLEFQCRRIDDRNIELESEIERLRSLITAWADAEDALTNAWNERGMSRGDVLRVDSPSEALRKAVGR